MLTNEIRLTVPGHPAPKGSLKCIGGRGGRGHVLIEDNARTKTWRDTLAGWTAKKWPTRQYADAGQPLGADITFTLPRPKSHYGTGRNVHQLKPSAPAWPVGHQTGDVDKLLRLVLDALQDAGVVPDDCAVVRVAAEKTFWAESAREATGDRLGYPGVVVRLYPID